MLSPDLNVAPQSAFSLVILLSGAAGAVVASVMTLWSTFYLDRKNKAWTLQAELRRHKVSRLILAIDGLRSCFFNAVTQMEYHRLELRDIEAEADRCKKDITKFATLTATSMIDNALESSMRETDRRTQQAMIRYNAEVSRIEASAKSLVESLDDPLLPNELYKRVRAVVSKLSESVTANAESVNSRTEFFHEFYSEIKSLLQELEAIVTVEIGKPIPTN